MAALKTMKTASRTWKSGRDEDGGDNSGQLGTTLSKVRAQTERRLGAWAPPPRGNGWKEGGKCILGKFIYS